MRRAVAAACVALGLTASHVAADPAPAPAPAPAPTADLSFAHLHSPRLACLGTEAAPTDCVQLPAGYFLSEPRYSALDLELKGLQDTRTRLQAENQSLRGTLASWQPGWITTVTTIAVGVALGIYIDHHL